MRTLNLSLRTLLTISILAALPIEIRSQDGNWPRFRGPNADGVAADDARLPSRWSRTENVQWTIDIPGWGWSSPIVWGDRVFLTSVLSDEQNEEPRAGLYLGEGVDKPAKGTHHWLVHCIDLDTGALVWKREAHVGNPVVPRHPKNTYAAETATTDGEHVFALFGDLGLFAFDMEGNLAWEQKFAPRKTMSNFGAAASPVVHEGQVIVMYDNQEESFIASYDAKTGKENWRTARDEGTTWATPLIWKTDLRTEIVTCGKRMNRSYDLEGNLLWEFDGNMSNLVIPSPYASDGLLYITSGYVGDRNRPVFAIRPGATGDISLDHDEASNEFIAWHQSTAGPYNPSSIVYGNRYYTLYDFGFLTCHDAFTGEEIFGKERFPGRNSFTSSPWAYNGKLFFINEEGNTHVVNSDGGHEVLHTNTLDELTLASPAISQGKLLIRTASKLYCITEPH